MEPLGAALARGDDEVGLLEHGEVLHHPEAAHPVGEGLADLTDGAAVVLEEQVEHLAPRGVGQSSEDGVLRIHAARLCDHMVTYQGAVETTR